MLRLRNTPTFLGMLECDNGGVVLAGLRGDDRGLAVSSCGSGLVWSGMHEVGPQALDLSSAGRALRNLRVGRELLVVVPVFNEEQCVESVLREWTAELNRSGIDYGLLILNDGSTDRTLEVIQNCAVENGAGRMEVVTHANRGHGQTCLEGYRRACWSGAPWVLQIDSDGQCDPQYFVALWERRRGHQIVYGQRSERRDGWTRVLATVFVRWVVRIAAGVDCADANVPYRLMSTAGLRPLVDTVPAGFDLANIALAVQIKRVGWSEATVPIVFRPRAGGEPSVPLVRFAGKAFELLGQLLLLPRPVQGGSI